MNIEAAHYRLCSSCKRPLPFGERYFTCSVSTCNRVKMTLTFCSVPCFSAHVPTLRHREAWAEEQRAPTRDKWLAELAREAAAETSKPDTKPNTKSAATKSAEGTPSREQKPGHWAPASSVTRRAAAATDNNPAAIREPSMPNEEVAKEVLIVVSKVKAYIRARAGMNTADAVSDALSDVVRAACDAAVERAKSDGRKTVMARDLEATPSTSTSPTE